MQVSLSRGHFTLLYRSEMQPIDNKVHARLPNWYHYLVTNRVHSIYIQQIKFTIMMFINDVTLPSTNTE